MSATYDYKNIKRYIQMHSDHIQTVVLGMHEDWYWTAVDVYEDGRFLYDLDEEPEIAGLKGSDWATPTMEITMKDGTEVIKDAYIGAVSGDKPEWFSLGCLSGPLQDYREGKLMLETK